MAGACAQTRTVKSHFPYSDCCSIESVIFNAVLCALLHAGIPLRRSFVSVTVALFDGAWVIDPLESEQVASTL
jgi:ribonuclease PH